MPMQDALSFFSNQANGALALLRFEPELDALVCLNGEEKPDLTGAGNKFKKIAAQVGIFWGQLFCLRIMVRPWLSLPLSI